MLDLLGITGISFVFLITLYFALTYKEILKFLLLLIWFEFYF